MVTATRAHKRKATKKPKQLTLFFESKDACARACASLGLSLRKVADIDRTHAGDYSKMTGHYGLKFEGGATVRVKIRSKLMIDSTLFESLTVGQRAQLGYLDVTSVGWIAP